MALYRRLLFNCGERYTVDYCLVQGIGERPHCQANQHIAEVFSPKSSSLCKSKAFSKPVKEAPRAHIYAAMTSCKRRI